MTPLQVKFFGTGRLLAGGAEIRLKSRAWTLPMLAYLVLHRGETIPRWRLAFVLWPEESEEGALQNLRRNLHLLVKALPAAPQDRPWIEADTESIAWNSAAEFEFDVAEFERLRADPQTLEEAVALYEGDLLEEIYDDWIAAERERLRRQYLSDLASLVIANRSRRAFDKAATYVQRLIAADPWREDAIRHLMAVRYESGDAAGALAEFDRFARALQEEIGAEPMVETLALREAIARGDAVPAAGDAEPVIVKRTPATSPLVGRDTELAELRTHWERAVRGNGGLMLVRGEAGIGKTRLVSELALIAEAEGGRILEGATSPFESGPYQCIAGALRRALPLIAASNVAPPLLAAVAELVPELRARRPELPASVRLEEASEQARLFDALAQLLIALAKPRPLLLILEDLHWAGAATIEAVGTLAQRTSGAAVAIVATHRDEPAVEARPLRALDRPVPGGAPVARLAVGPLREDDVLELTRAFGSGNGALLRIAPTVFARSEGNPLFVTEMLREAQRGGTEGFVLPASIREMIATRLAVLDPPTRAVAEVAAVVGAGFSVDVVRDVAGLPESDVLVALDHLLDNHLVRESHERGGYDYAFTHHLLQMAIYDAVPLSARTRRHRRVAKILKQLSPDASREHAAEIALHFERGGDAQSAAEHYALAAARAAQLYANVEARVLADRALALYPSDDRLRFGLLLLRCRMSARIGDAEMWELDKLDEVAARLEGEAVCEALAQRIDLADRRHDLDAESRATELLEGQAHASHDERWAARASEAHARVAVRRFELDGAIAAAGEALRRYETLEDTEGRARIAAITALAYASAGRWVEADRASTEARALAERVGDAEVLLRVMRDMANVAAESADYEHLAEIGRTALELCRRTGDRRAEADAHGLIGTALYTRWQVEGAREHLRAAIALFDSLRSPRVAVALNNLGCLLIDIGQYDEALEVLERAWEVSTTNSFADGAVLTLTNAMDAVWQRGAVVTMRAFADRLGTEETLPGTRYPAHAALSWGRLLRCEGNVAASIERLEQALEGFRELGRRSDEIDVLDDFALSFIAAGQPEKALDALARGIEVERSGDAPPPLQFPTRHYWIAACVRRLAGDGEGARDELQRLAHEYDARCAAIVDPGARASFEAIPFHRALAAAREKDEWPAPTSRCLVAFAAPIGKALA